MDSLSGFNVAGRYLVLLYYNERAIAKKYDIETKKLEMEQFKKMYFCCSYFQEAPRTQITNRNKSQIHESHR